MLTTVFYYEFLPQLRLQIFIANNHQAGTLGREFGVLGV